MPKFDERRLFSRYPAVNLLAEIDGRLFDVTDISLEGVRVKGLTRLSGKSLTFFLYSAGAGHKHKVRATGTLAVRYRDAVALRFEHPTMSLMKLVMQQVSLELGVEPYAVK